MQVLDKGKEKQDYYDALEQLKHSFHRSIEIVLKLRDLGAKYGLSNEIIRSDIEQILEGIIKPRQLRNLLPPELKHVKKANKAKHVAAITASTIVFQYQITVNQDKRKIAIPAATGNR